MNMLHPSGRAPLAAMWLRCRTDHDVRWPDASDKFPAIPTLPPAGSWPALAQPRIYGCPGGGARRIRSRLAAYGRIAGVQPVGAFGGGLRRSSGHLSASHESALCECRLGHGRRVYAGRLRGSDPRRDRADHRIHSPVGASEQSE